MPQKSICNTSKFVTVSSGISQETSLFPSKYNFSYTITMFQSVYLFWRGIINNLARYFVELLLLHLKTSQKQDITSVSHRELVCFHSHLCNSELSKDETVVKNRKDACRIVEANVIYFN
jgi:hypothetical protein